MRRLFATAVLAIFLPSMFSFLLVLLPSNANALELFDKAKSWVKALDVLNSAPEKCDEPPPGAANNAARVPARAISAPGTGKSTVSEKSPTAVPVANGEVARPAAAAKSSLPNGLYKTEAEMREYFKCYIDNPAHIKAALEKYIPMINAAAKAYDIPPTLLGCLLFRESMFNQNARSGSGALGLSQQLPKNLSYLTNVLKSRTADEAREIEEMAARTPEEQVTFRKNQIRLSIAESEIAQAKSRRKSLRLMRRWEAYFQDITRQKLRAGQIPRLLNSTNVRNDPAIAIGAGAMYLRDILIAFRSTLDPSVQVDQAGVASDPDLLLAAAGAYNMGPGGESKDKNGRVVTSGARQFIKPVVSQGYGAWVKALTESNEETSAHIISIQNCMRPTSQEDPWAPPIGTAPRDCKNPVDGKYPTLSSKPAALPADVQRVLSRKQAEARAAAAAARANRAPKKPSAPAAKPASKPSTKPTTSKKPAPAPTKTPSGGKK